MSNMILSLPEPAVGIVTKATKAYAYVNGQRSEERVVDAEGRPITRLTLFGSCAGKVAEFKAEVPDGMAEDIAEQQVVVIQGNNAQVQLRAMQYEMTMTVSGADNLRVVGDAQQIFAQYTKAASGKAE